MDNKEEKKIINIDYSDIRRKLLDEYLSQDHEETPTYSKMVKYLSTHEELKKYLESSTTGKISKSTISRDLQALNYSKQGSEYVKIKDTNIKKLKRGYKDYLIGKYDDFSFSKKFANKLKNYYRKEEEIEGINENTRILVYSLTLIIKLGYEAQIGRLIYDAYSFDRKLLAVFPGIGCVKVETTSIKLYNEINKHSKVPPVKK
jgi:hypothetical protein